MTPAARTKPDLGSFARLPAGRAGEVQRLGEFARRFPHLQNFDWEQHFDADAELFGAIVRDMLRLGAERRHTWGPRDMPDDDEGRASLRQWRGEDYSLFPFNDTFAVMTEGMSQRQLAHKLSLDRNMIRRLAAGKLDPDRWLLETIAKAFKKQPSFFMEYRLLYVANAMVDRMQKVPESSVSVYRKLSQGNLDRGAQSSRLDP